LRMRQSAAGLKFMKNTFEILLAKAEADARTVKILLANSDSPREAIAFHIQQMTEKLLKAVLIHGKIDYPYKHNLVNLLSKADKLDDSFKIFSDFAADLTPYGVAARYDERYNPSAADVEGFYSAALNLRRKVYQYLGRNPPPL